MEFTEDRRLCARSSLSSAPAPDSLSASFFFFFYRQVYQNFFEYDSIMGPHLYLSDMLMQFPQCKAIHFLGFRIAPTQSDFSVWGLCCLQPSQLQIWESYRRYSGVLGLLLTAILAALGLFCVFLTLASGKKITSTRHRCVLPISPMFVWCPSSFYSSKTHPALPYRFRVTWIQAIYPVLNDYASKISTFQ